jgi:hypothetical protein
MNFTASNKLQEFIHKYKLRINHIALFKTVERLMSDKSKNWIEENAVVGKGTRLKIQKILKHENITDIDQLYPDSFPALRDHEIVKGWKSEYSKFLDIVSSEWTLEFLERRLVPSVRAIDLLEMIEKTPTLSPEYLTICLEINLWSYKNMTAEVALKLCDSYLKSLRVIGVMPKTVEIGIKYQSWRSDAHHKAYRRALKFHTVPENVTEVFDTSLFVSKENESLDKTDDQFKVNNLHSLETILNQSMEMTFWETIYPEDERYLGVDE